MKSSSLRLLVVVFAILLFASLAVNVYLTRDLIQAPKLSSSPPTLEKFKVSAGFADAEAFFVPAEIAKDRGIWSANGLDPEFIHVIGRHGVAADIKEHVASGMKIGLNTAAFEVLFARANGVPVKIVAGYIGKPINWLFTRADGPIKTIKDLDGKKVGVLSTSDFTYHVTTIISNKFAIKPEIVPLGNITNQVVALKEGRIDAFDSSDVFVFRLVDSGELRILFSYGDIVPSPYVTWVMWSTDDIIEQNPALV